MQKNSLSTVLFITEEEQLNALNHLLSNFKSIDVSASFQNAYEFIEYMNNHKTSILFIDLEKLELIKFILKPTFIIGLCDISESKKLKKYLNFGVFDFIFTPIKENNFTTTISKILNIYGSYHNLSEEAFTQVEENNISYANTEKNNPQKNHIFLKCYKSNEIFKLIFENILFLKLNTNIIEIHLDKDEVKFVKSSLKYFESLLPEEHFQKINQNIIVNLEKITGSKNNEKIMIQDNVFNVTRSFKKNIKLFFKYKK